MSSCNILSYVLSSSTASLENEYSYVWKCSPSLWFIMDEGALYGCHNSVLSVARSPTALLRGSSQFIIDHPSSPHLLSSAQDERMGMRRDNKSNTETKRVSGRVWKVVQQLRLKLFTSYSIFWSYHWSTLLFFSHSH